MFPERMSVREFSMRWLDHQRTRLRAQTHRRFEELLTGYVLPVVGATEMRRLRPAHVQRVLDEMGSKGLAARTVIQARAVFGGMMRAAVAWGVVATNPVAAVKPPKPERPKLDVPTPEQLVALMEASKGTAWEAAVVIAATTGMRRGEVLGLRWADVDLDGGKVRVEQALQRMPGKGAGLGYVEPKTDRARRQFHLPRYAVERMRAHKVRQNERRLAAGAAWEDQDLVCDNGLGGPLDPTGFSKAFKRLAATAGLAKGMRLHDARHGVATAMLAKGVHPAVASAVLGHSSPAFTMSTYQHVLEGMTATAAEALDAALDL